MAWGSNGSLRVAWRSFLHRKAFVGPPQAGQNMHWRGASFAMAEGTASPTYSSLKSKQRGFCCPRQLLLVWKHLVLLVLPSLASPQTAEVSQSSEFKRRAEAPAVSQQVGVSASTSLSPARITLWKTRKYFLADSVEDGSCSNTSKTWSENHAEVGSTSVMNPDSTARLSSSQLLRCSDQAAGARNQERISAFQLTLFHPNFKQLKDRLSTADKHAWIQPMQADLQRCCALTGPGKLVRWSESPLRTCLKAKSYWAMCLTAKSSLLTSALISVRQLSAWE